MTTTRSAAYSCGQLSLEAEAEPVRISICRCLACQRRVRRSGALSARARANRRRSTRYVRVCDSGNRLLSEFRPDCGATLDYTLEGQPELIAVPIGAFADPTFPARSFSVYESRRHAWVGLPDYVVHDD
jgi:hypothetical protein